MGTEETANAGGCTAEEWGEMWRRVGSSLSSIPPTDANAAFSPEHIALLRSKLGLAREQFELVKSKPPRDERLSQAHRAGVSFLASWTLLLKALVRIGELGALSKQRGLSRAEASELATAELEARNASSLYKEWSAKSDQALRELAKSNRELFERLKL